MVNYISDWILNIKDIVPPYCVEVVLRNGSQYYLHSVVTKEEETKTIVIRIWDFRAFSQSDHEELKLKLNKIKSRDNLSKEKDVHLKLDWANLRIYLNEIAYCIEWHDRLWTEEERPKIGFTGEK